MRKLRGSAFFVVVTDDRAMRATRAVMHKGATIFDEERVRGVLEPLLLGKGPAAFVGALHQGRLAADPVIRDVCSRTVLFWDHLDRNPYRALISPL